MSKTVVASYPKSEEFDMDLESHTFTTATRYIRLGSFPTTPFISPDRTVAVIVDGAIYNYKELAALLKGRGYQFTGKDESECILHLYKEFKENFVEKLEGTFSIVIADLKTNALLLARDRFGSRPLFYSLTKTSFYCGSEVKSILPYVDKSLEKSNLSKYFTFKYNPHSIQTIFSSIQKVAPGHLITVNLSSNQIKTHQYWSPRFTPKYVGSYTDAKMELYEVLSSSVEECLQSENPVGLFLSGGLDSSILSILASKINPDIKTYSIGFREANEFDFIHKLTRDKNLTNHRYLFSERDIRSTLNDVIRFMNEPIADPSQLPLLELSKLVSKTCDTILSGEGADELFGGHTQYERVIRVKNTADDIAYTQFLKQSGYFLDGDILINPKFKNELGNTLAFLKPFFLNPLLDGMLNMDQHTWLPSNTLPILDRTTSEVSIQSRLPYLNHKLVKLVNSFPPEWKLKTSRKQILKDVAKLIGIPTEIIAREKESFSVPVHKYLSGGLNSVLKETVRAEPFVSLNCLDSNRVRSITDNLTPATSLRVWTIFIFALWYNHISND